MSEPYRPFVPFWKRSMRPAVRGIGKTAKDLRSMRRGAVISTATRMGIRFAERLKP